LATTKLIACVIVDLKCLQVWLRLFFKVFFLINILKYFFYFLKIIFDISASKLSENIKKYINLKKKLKIFLKRKNNSTEQSFFLLCETGYWISLSARTFLTGLCRCLFSSFQTLLSCLLGSCKIISCMDTSWMRTAISHPWNKKLKKLLRFISFRFGSLTGRYIACSGGEKKSHGSQHNFINFKYTKFWFMQVFLA